MENEKYLNEFQRKGRTLHTIYANDAKRNVKTNLHKITIDKDANISDTRNLPYCLKLCEGSRVMLTKNMDISHCLINGAIGTAVKIHRRAASRKPSGVLFVYFDDPEAGNKSKSNCCRDELKDCVPTEAVTQQFLVSKNKSKNSDLIGERVISSYFCTCYDSSQITREYYSIFDRRYGSVNQKPLSINSKLMKVCFILFSPSHNQ